MTRDPFNRSQYLSAQEIADLRLPDMPVTKSGVIRRAKQEGWPFVDRHGRGGGRLYAISDLPDEARADYHTRRIAERGDDGRRQGRPAGTDFLSRHPEVADAIEVILAHHRHSARNIAALLRAEGLPVPSPRSLRRFIARIEDEKRVLLTTVRNPDKARSTYRLSLGDKAATVTRYCQVWEIDTTKADIMCTDGRKAILGIIDRWSRRAFYQVCEAESAQAVRRILVDAIRRWGVMPETMKVDRGSGFINASIGSALELLGIELDPCLPGTPQDKPFVERLFGTFQHERAPLFDGFIGHNVAQAQELRARARRKTGKPVVEAAISSAELQAAIDAWIDGEYHQRTHSMLRCSPMAKWQASPERARAAPAEDVLKMALSAFVAVGTVTKRGIRWKNGRYWAEGLAPWMGRQVVIRRDEEDLGALFIFDENGRYIDTAINHERSGLSQRDFAMAAARQYEGWRKQQQRELAEKKKTFSFERMRDQLLRAEAEAAGKLHHLPGPTQPASTPMIDSMADRVHAPAPVPAGQSEGARIVAMRAPEQSPFQRMAQTDAIIAAADRGEAVDPDLLRQARIHATSDNYISTKVAAGEWTYDQAREVRRTRGRRGAA